MTWGGSITKQLSYVSKIKQDKYETKSNRKIKSDVLNYFFLLRVRNRV